MWAELRHLHTDTWVLEVRAVRDDRPAWYFGDQIQARAGQETAVAAARLALAGYQVRGWSEVAGGWDGDVAMSRT
jgi:hypothetical protein